MKTVFWRKLLAAFAAAGWTFTIPYLAITVSFVVRSADSPIGGVETFFTSILLQLAICLAIIVAVLFLIAYPLERLWDRKSRGVAARIGLYCATFTATGAGSLAAYYVLMTTHIAPALTNWPNSSWFIVVLYGSVVAAVIAAIARPIYPVLLKRPRLSILLSSVLLVLTLSTFAWPRYSSMAPSNSAPMGVGIYPAQLTGELARGTWTVNHNSGISSTDFFVSGKSYSPNRAYELIFQCLPQSHAIQYQATVRDAGTLKTVFTRTFTCSDNGVHIARIPRINHPFVAGVLLSPVSNSGNFRDAFAILAPVGAWEND